MNEETLESKGLTGPEASDLKRLGILSIPAQTIVYLIGLGHGDLIEIADIYGPASDTNPLPLFGVKVLSHSFCFQSQSYRLLVEHPSLPFVVPGMMIPVLDVKWRLSELGQIEVR